MIKSSALKAARTIAVTGHMRPDGDCIGSELAIGYALKNLGKKVTVFSQDEMPDKLAFLDRSKILTGPTAPLMPRWWSTAPTSNAWVPFAIPSVNAARSSTSIITAPTPATATSTGSTPNPPVAANSSIAFSSRPSGPSPRPLPIAFSPPSAPIPASFQYPTTQPSTYHAAAELVNRGAISRDLRGSIPSYPLSRVKLQKHMYNSFKLTQQNQVAYFWLRQADYKKAGAVPDESEGLIDHIRDIQGVKVACLFEEIEPEITRISLRSKLPEVNASILPSPLAAAAANPPPAPDSWQTQYRTAPRTAAVKQALAKATIPLMPRNRSRQPENELHGALLIDKPAGPTSHDIVDIIRGQYGLQKVGHCGTLDPAATGLLILLLGRATKLSMKLTADHKVYEGSIEFGKTTDSYDAQGDITATAAVPSLDCEALNTAAQSFQGDIQQKPPMVSAVKKDGVPLYKLARKGKTIEREAKPVHIFSFDSITTPHPSATFRVHCSKGTYVRSLAHELGEQLGCGAPAHPAPHASGKFDVADAIRLEDLVKTAGSRIARPRALARGTGSPVAT